MASVFFHWIKVALVIGLISYLVILAYFWAFQRSYLYHPNTIFADPQHASVSGIDLITLHTQDNLSLVAWHLPPANPDAPVILYFNGNGDNIALWDNRWQRIYDAGAGFLAVSYRGYGGSEGNPTEIGLHADGLAGYEWLSSHYPTDRIVVHGYSLGSGVAVQLAANHAVKALILEAPYLSIEDRAGELLPFLPVGLLLKDHFYSNHWIKKVNKPVLIVHGDQDKVIGFHHGEALYHLANEPKKFVNLKGGDHYSATTMGLYPIIWNFLGYNPAPTRD